MEPKSFVIIDDDGTRRKIPQEEIVRMITIPYDSDTDESVNEDELNDDAVSIYPDDDLLNQVDKFVESLSQELYAENSSVPEEMKDIFEGYVDVMQDLEQCTSNAIASTSRDDTSKEFNIKSTKTGCPVKIKTRKHDVRNKENQPLTKKELSHICHWTENCSPAEKVEFAGRGPFPDDLYTLKTPFQFFKYFFSDELLKFIVLETNRFYEEKKSQKNQINYQCNGEPSNQKYDIIQIERFIGIAVMTSLVQVPNVRDLWDPAIGNQLVQESMGVNQFEDIRANLHFCNNNEMPDPNNNDRDKLFKIRQIIDHLNSKFGTIPMDESLSVDEQICATKMRHHLKQYNPKKPHKWGFKLFALCDSNGFLYQFEIYSGHIETFPNLGASANVVLRMTQHVPNNKYHKVYCDNYFTNIPLFQYLWSKGILAIGTIRKDRVPNYPFSDKSFFKKGRGAIREASTTFNDCNMRLVLWKDNNLVHLLSSCEGAEPLTKITRYNRKEKMKESIPCPAVVVTYNKHMGGVDLIDAHVGRLKINLKSRKWYFKLFYHLIDIAIINAWTVYKQITNEQITQKKFRIQLAETLLNIGSKTSPRRGRPPAKRALVLTKSKKNKRPNVDIRFDGHIHWPEHSSKARCKNDKCKSYSRICCRKCNVHLCLSKTKNCFIHFHGE